MQTKLTVESSVQKWLTQYSSFCTNIRGQVQILRMYTKQPTVGTNVLCLVIPVLEKDSWSSLLASLAELARAKLSRKPYQKS